MNLCDKVAAVIVTYNRLNLLKECIGAVRVQSKKVDEIIIVNNLSTDGTYEWLRAQKDLSIITQENLGSAGGFYTGIKTAYEKGYDWVWCMDDDGYTDSEALLNLLKLADNDDKVLNCLAVDKINKQKLSFGYYDKKNKKEYEFIEQIKKHRLIESVSFFNGTLIPKKIIQCCGYPNKAYFIRGDEIDYYYHIKKHGFSIFIVTDSIIFHPSPNRKAFSFLGKRYDYELMQIEKKKYQIKNIIINFLKYRQYSKKYLFRILCSELIITLFMQKKIKTFLILFIAIFSGFFHSRKYYPHE